MLPHPLTNFEMTLDLFIVVYSRDHLTETEDGAYVISLDEYSDIGTHWVALYVHNDDVTYFDSFGLEHIWKVIY